jgi:hypothetical protein
MFFPHGQERRLENSPGCKFFCPGLGENSTESGNQTVHVSLDTDLESATGAIRAIAQHSFLIL